MAQDGWPTGTTHHLTHLKGSEIPVTLILSKCIHLLPPGLPLSCPYSTATTCHNSWVYKLINILNFAVSSILHSSNGITHLSWLHSCAGIYIDTLKFQVHWGNHCCLACWGYDSDSCSWLMKIKSKSSLVCARSGAPKYFKPSVLTNLLL